MRKKEKNVEKKNAERDFLFKRCFVKIPENYTNRRKKGLKRKKKTCRRLFIFSLSTETVLTRYSRLKKKQKTQKSDHRSYRHSGKLSKQTSIFLNRGKRKKEKCNHGGSCEGVMSRRSAPSANSVAAAAFQGG